MTAYNEYAEVLEELYSGCDCQFIKKPLDNREIKQAVKSSIKQYELKR